MYSIRQKNAVITKLVYVLNLMNIQMLMHQEVFRVIFYIPESNNALETINMICLLVHLYVCTHVYLCITVHAHLCMYVLVHSHVNVHVCICMYG